MVIKVTSNVFKEGEHIPDRYACRGVNISPPLEWEDVAWYSEICNYL